MAVLCTTPSATPACNQFNLQDPMTQKYLLIHLLADLLSAATDDAELKALASGWQCQGSPAKLRLDQAQAIVAADFTGVDLDHINCWSPLELEAVMAYLVCLGTQGVT